MKIHLSRVKKLLPKRFRHSSKIDGGSVLILAGGTKFHGAGILSALAATRSGAGYTHLMSEIKRYPWLKFPDFILHNISRAGLQKHLDSVIAMGPGLGVNAKNLGLLRYLLSKRCEKVILDADALTMLSKMRINKLPSTWILTPHEGEAARLLKVKSSWVKENRRKAIDKLHEKYQCTVLLKGADTLILSEENFSVVSEGPSALAKAGSGDVLLGMIAAFYAQGLRPHEAAVVGSFVQGFSAKAWLKKGNDHLSMRPLDVIEEIPKALLNIRK